MIQLPSGKFSLAKHHRAANWLKNIDNFTSHPNLEGKACPQNGTCRIYLFAFIREKVDGDVEGEMWCSDESGTAKKWKELVSVPRLLSEKTSSVKIDLAPDSEGARECE